MAYKGPGCTTATHRIGTILYLNVVAMVTTYRHCHQVPLGRCRCGTAQPVWPGTRCSSRTLPPPTCGGSAH